MSSIEGIPEGWELVRIGCPVPSVDWVLNQFGEPVLCSVGVSTKNYVVVRKVEKPKTYRPFANAAEFKPHRDRWWMHPREPDKRFKPGDYNDQGVWGLDRRHYDYQHLFECGTLFDDGTPFGVEVKS